ncbi:MAG: Rho termination factor N-terminal domain-containing protein [Deltaproteobacteria bacterium]|nr:Rho termination factor N-terminal domain-containing protein [Deltaproteobacteria bacterium]
MSDEKAETTEKPLEKMTVKALREMAKEIPEISGVHGMKKEELIVAINEVRGVKEETVKEETVKEETAKEETAEAETVKADKSSKTKPAPKKAGANRGAIKTQIRALKAQRRDALEARDRKMATVYKRRISRLKKKSRKAAA